MAIVAAAVTAALALGSAGASGADQVAVRELARLDAAARAAASGTGAAYPAPSRLIDRVKAIRPELSVSGAGVDLCRDGPPVGVDLTASSTRRLVAYARSGGGGYFRMVASGAGPPAVARVARCPFPVPFAMGAVVPAYVPSSSPVWRVLTRSPRGVATVIINPQNGPDGARRPALAARVDALRRAGITTLGYIATNFGRRRAALVEADMRRYRRWYGVDGYFLDEASTERADLPYYRLLRRAADRRTVMLNPGAVPDPGYLSAADQIVTFEGTAAAYRDARFPPWTANQPPSRFVHVVYSTPAAQRKTVLALARARNAGLVFITDAGAPNPYDRLPPYFAAERDELAQAR